MIFTTDLQVDAHDVDANGILRLSPLLRYMQSAANLQLHTYGPSNEALREEDKAFILSRMTMKTYATINNYDHLTVETWSVEGTGFSFHRCYRILRHKKVVAEGASVWALVDIKSHSFVRASDIVMHFTHEPALPLELPPRIGIPKDLGFCLVGEYTVLYSDCDQNNHMNNTRYGDLLCSFYPMENIHVTRSTIHYLNEAPKGETLRVYRAKQGDSIFFRTLREDGKINAEAEFIFT